MKKSNFATNNGGIIKTPKPANQPKGTTVGGGAKDLRDGK